MPFRVGPLELIIALIIAMLSLSPFVLLIYLLMSGSGQNRNWDREQKPSEYSVN